MLTRLYDACSLFTCLCHWLEIPDFLSKNVFEVRELHFPIVPLLTLEPWAGLQVRRTAGLQEERGARLQVLQTLNGRVTKRHSELRHL